MNPDDLIESQPTGFDSRDCVNVIIETEGDNTSRPCRPELLKDLMAERERLQRCLGEDNANGS